MVHRGLPRAVVVSGAIALAALASGCSNECKDAAKNYTDLAAQCGDASTTFEFTGECDETAINCINACDFLSNDVCDTTQTTDCVNGCIAGPGAGGGGVGGATP